MSKVLKPNPFLSFLNTHKGIDSGAYILILQVGTFCSYDGAEVDWKSAAMKKILDDISKQLPDVENARAAFTNAGKDDLLRQFNQAISSIRMSGLLGDDLGHIKLSS